VGWLRGVRVQVHSREEMVDESAAMIRIVGGTARGRGLSVPGRGTRPTSDRAREALFNTLTGLIELTGSDVLDLYAGTGAVGLEALSRGAGTATLVESDPAVLSVLRSNVAALAPDRAHVVARSVPAYLGQRPALDLIRFAFLDPPYALPESALESVLGQLADLLPTDAVVVVERGARGVPLTWPTVIESIKQKRYGEGVLWYGRRK
jgi:16S rRNA (guanine966-N2)-methyltransferase